MKSGVWVLCRGGCDDYWCTIHKLHVYDCECPGIDVWVDAGAWPYREAEPSEPSGASSPRHHT